MNNPLVSVLVLSYNSSSTIEETLNSINNQTYSNIEIIISDDFSSDNTLNIVKKWAEENEDHFKKIYINEHHYNVGVTQNMIDGFNHVSGEWIKIIAADDILYENCIESDLLYINKSNKKIDFLLTNMLCFDSKNEWLMVGKFNRLLIKSWNYKTDFLKKNTILKKCLYLSPSAFFKSDICKKLKIDFNVCRNVEDWPFQISVVHSGFNIHYRDEVTVKYRKSDISLSNHQNNRYYNINMLNSVNTIKKSLCYPLMKKWDIIYWWGEILEKIKEFLLIKIFNNEKSLLGDFIKFIINCFFWNGWKENIITILNCFH